MPIFRRTKQTFNPVEERVATLASVKALVDRTQMTTAGVIVNPETAVSLSAVWAAVELVASVGGTMPLDEFRKVGNDQLKMPLSSVFADPDPDPSVSAVGLRAQLLRSAAIYGNAYATVFTDSTGVATGLATIHPDRVAWKLAKSETGWAWETYVDNVRRERWPNGDLFHFALFQEPGSPIGRSPVAYHRQTIGQSLAAQKFGQQFFDGGGNPSLIIKPPVRLTPDEAKALKQQVTDVTRGTREPLVMPREIEIERLTIPAEDSQFLETQRYGVEEVARVFLGGFPELIGGSVTGSSVTYANREQRNADFIALSLAPRYLVPLETALSTLVPRGRFVKHNMDALLRSDLAARYSSYKTAAEVSAIMGTPLLTINDMRRYENMEPVENGDTFPYPPATPAEPAPMAARSETPIIVEHRGMDTKPSETHIHLPESAWPAQRTDDGPHPLEVLTHFIGEQRQLTADQLDAIRALAATMPAPVVNVTSPDVIVNVPEPPAATIRVDAPSVTVNPAITVEQPAPVVNVTSPDVVVNVPPEQLTRKRVVYDRNGRVSEVVEEPN